MSLCRESSRACCCSWTGPMWRFGLSITRQGSLPPPLPTNRPPLNNSGIFTECKIIRDQTSEFVIQVFKCWIGHSKLEHSRSFKNSVTSCTSTKKFSILGPIITLNAIAPLITSERRFSLLKIQGTEFSSTWVLNICFLLVFPIFAAGWNGEGVTFQLQWLAVVAQKSGMSTCSTPRTSPAHSLQAKGKLLLTEFTNNLLFIRNWGREYYCCRRLGLFSVLDEVRSWKL